MHPLKPARIPATRTQGRLDFKVICFIVFRSPLLSSRIKPSQVARSHFFANCQPSFAPAKKTCRGRALSVSVQPMISRTIASSVSRWRQWAKRPWRGVAKTPHSGVAMAAAAATAGRVCHRNMSLKEAFRHTNGCRAWMFPGSSCRRDGRSTGGVSAIASCAMANMFRPHGGFAEYTIQDSEALIPPSRRRGGGRRRHAMRGMDGLACAS